MALALETAHDAAGWLSEARGWALQGGAHQDVHRAQDLVHLVDGLHPNKNQKHFDQKRLTQLFRCDNVSLARYSRFIRSTLRLCY